MSHFDKDFLDFFRELSANNNTEWFHANKKRYEKSAKGPFIDFVNEMILRIKSVEPELEMEAKQAMFRINRDIRFAKDKSPYKAYMAANISKGGRMSPQHPGFYFQFSHEGIYIGGGAHHVEKDGLYRIRTSIARDPKELDRLQAGPEFRKKYDQIEGEKNKRLPKEFQETQEVQPLIANKQFYFMAQLGKKAILDPRLPDILMEYYMAGKEINDFLEESLKEK